VERRENDVSHKVLVSIDEFAHFAVTKRLGDGRRGRSVGWFQNSFPGETSARGIVENTGFCSVAVSHSWFTVHN